MTNNITTPPGGEQTALKREQIIRILNDEVAKIWNSVPLSLEIKAKIKHGYPLDALEATSFLLNENRNIQSLRDHLPGILQKLSNNEPDLLEKLIGGKHILAEHAKSGVTKFLLALDGEERFYIDLFLFAPKASTAKHDHNAHCISYQLEGNLREVVYRQVTPNHQLVESKLKPAGHSTIVSPYGDHDNIHAISNDSGKLAATIHVYAQRLLGKDNIVTINRSSAANGPTSVVRILSGNSNGEIIPWQEKTGRIGSYLSNLAGRSSSFLESFFQRQNAGGALSA